MSAWFVQGGFNEVRWMLYWQNATLLTRLTDPCPRNRSWLSWPLWPGSREVSLLTDRFDQCPLIDSTLHWSVNYRTLLTKPSVSRQCCRQCCHVVRPCNKTLHHEDGAGTHNMHWVASVLQCTQLHVCRVCTLTINVSVYVYNFYN